MASFLSDSTKNANSSSQLRTLPFFLQHNIYCTRRSNSLQPQTHELMQSTHRSKSRNFTDRIYYLDPFVTVSETQMDSHLKNLFSRFHEQFGSGPGLGPGSGTCLMKIDGIGPPFIKSLYKSAASLYRSDPWRRLRPGHLFRVRVGKDWDWPGRKQPFPCLQFVGGDGGDLGIHMFRSPDDAVKATGCRETIRVPNVEIFRVTYEVESTMFLSNKRMVKSLGLEKSGEDRFPVFDVVRCGSSGDDQLEFRNPTMDELRFVYAVMRAVALVHPLLEEDVGAGPKYDRLARFQPLIETVDVQWSVEMSRGNDLVAVTVSHPLNQGYEERNGLASSTPTKDSEGYNDE